MIDLFGQLLKRLTAARAAKLDLIDALVSSRQASIRSIQHATLTVLHGSTSGTTAISSVTMSKTRLIDRGVLGASNAGGYSAVYARLNSATQLYGEKANTFGESKRYATVLEFN